MNFLPNFSLRNRYYLILHIHVTLQPSHFISIILLKSLRQQRRRLHCTCGRGNRILHNVRVGYIIWQIISTLRQASKSLNKEAYQLLFLSSLYNISASGKPGERFYVHLANMGLANLKSYVQTSSVFHIEKIAGHYQKIYSIPYSYPCLWYG